MNLYERDYTKIITQEERDAQILFEEFETKKGIKYLNDNPLYSHPDYNCRNFLWCHNSRFPNNSLLHFRPEVLNLSCEAKQFMLVLDESKNENQIQSYIKDNKKWFIPGSIFKEYSFGNGEAYLFPELRLGAEYQVDYALLGENSDGYSIVFVEFENANTPFLISTSNTESESVRKGVAQIKNWKRWIEDNRDYFFKNGEFKDKGISIPTYRIFNCLVVGRREHMSTREIEVRSQTCYENLNFKIISFDRIVDYIQIINTGY